MPIRTAIQILVLLVSLPLQASPPIFQESPQVQLEQEGIEALELIGYNPAYFSPRQKREAATIRRYQAAWNYFDASVTDFSKVAAPGLILSHYTDSQKIVYRDMCVPHGLSNKQDFGKYLQALYQKFPRQIWGHGWEKIHLFAGAKPGEWSYYYNFEMFRANALDQAALAGTGMERIQFDDDGKLISDEVHLILETGTANCGRP